jgi:serine/threonine protein kinase
MILSNDSKDVPRKEGSLTVPRAVSLFATPPVAELLSIENDDQGIPGKASGFTFSQETAGGPKEEDPFSNWSGSGRHPGDLDQFTNPNCLTVCETTIYHGGRYRFHSVLWKSYVLTRKTVVLDNNWTRTEAFREVECLGLLMHSHIIQVVGSYSLGNRFLILLYPGTEWTLHGFLQQNSPQIEDFGARKRIIAKFFVCLISALGYIHETRLRHGNIRPRSILVARSTSHQERFKVYLTGFDLAHQPRVPASVLRILMKVTRC